MCSVQKIIVLLPKAKVNVFIVKKELEIIYIFAVNAKI